MASAFRCLRRLRDVMRCEAFEPGTARGQNILSLACQDSCLLTNARKTLGLLLHCWNMFGGRNEQVDNEQS